MTLTIDDYQGALKQLSKIPKEAYLLISFRYDRQLILPYKQGIAVMEALEHAMVYDSAYSGPPTYKPITDEISVNLLSSEILNDIKVARLLNITQDSAKSLRESK